MKLGILWWVPCWPQDLKEQLNAGWLHSMLVFLVGFSFSALNLLILKLLVFYCSCMSQLCCVETVPIRTVNRQCSSGLQAVADVAAAIRAGFYDIGKVHIP